MSLYSAAEKNIKFIGMTGVRQLLKYYGVNVEIQKLQKTVYSDVYGADAGGPLVKQSLFIKALLVGDDFFESDNAASGNFQQGWMYLDNKDKQKVGSGDIIKVIRDDNTSFRYKVGKIETIGFTTKVFSRYELVSIGD